MISKPCCKRLFRRGRVSPCWGLATNRTEHWASLRAIVAGRIDQFNVARPIVADHIYDFEHSGVLQPAGQVLVVGDGLFESETGWLADVKEQEHETAESAEANR